jgi:hypothetical protein
MDPLLHQLVAAISDIDSGPYFSKHIGQHQSDQRTIVNRFQNHVCLVLDKTLPAIKWQVEYCPNRNQRDSIDIFGQGENFVIAIELDKHRADQVAKKFVSRMAILPDIRIYYVSLCYPGTARMNSTECVKYFGYCADLSKRMGNEYAGLIIQ